MQRNNNKDSNGNTPLHRAVINNDIETVKTILSQGGVDQTIKNNNGENCLHLAAKMGDVDMMSVLLNYWFDLEEPDGKGNTCLHIAVKENKVEIVKLLLEHWVDIDIKNKDGKMSLDLLDIKSQTDASRAISDLLLKARVEEDLLIHSAAKKGNLAQVKKLLAIEPDSINARDISGRTPLYLAVLNKHWEVAEYLIEQGANVNLATKQKGAFYAGTPFCLALINKNSNFALLLLKKGAQFHRVVGEAKISPIHIAIQKGQNGIVEELIQRRPELINVKDRNKSGRRSPICFVSHNLKIIGYLLDHGANTDDAVRYAVNANQEAMALKLIEHGVPFPIHDGVMMGSLPILGKLLDQNLVLESKDSQKRTPLWVAIENRIKNKHQVIKYLLGRGANIYAKNKEGKQIIEYKENDLEIEKLLKQADLYHKYQLEIKVISLKMNDEEKTAVFQYITTVLTGYTQRVALKNALNSQHILHQRLFADNTFMSFLHLQPKLDKAQLAKKLAQNIDIKIKRLETDYPAVYAARAGDCRC